MGIASSMPMLDGDLLRVLSRLDCDSRYSGDSKFASSSHRSLPSLSLHRSILAALCYDQDREISKGKGTQENCDGRFGVCEDWRGAKGNNRLKAPTSFDQHRFVLNPSGTIHASVRFA